MIEAPDSSATYLNILSGLLATSRKADDVLLLTIDVALELIVGDKEKFEAVLFMLDPETWDRGGLP